MITRSEFLKRLAGLGAGMALGGVATAAPQPTEPLLLWEGPLAGFRYYEGPVLLPTLAAGQPLRLRPEPENRHDAMAIAIDLPLPGTIARLGYIPRQDNPILFRLLQGGFPLRATILHIHPDASDWGKVWVRVEMGENVILPESLTFQP